MVLGLHCTTSLGKLRPWVQDVYDFPGWTQTDYQNKHYNINQKDEGT